MKKELLDILACPVCKGTLELKVEQEEAGRNITQGFLYCSMCCVRYLIVDGIPELLPPHR
jgi:uncharacterized protein